MDKTKYLKPELMAKIKVDDEDSTEYGWFENKKGEYDLFPMTSSEISAALMSGYKYFPALTVWDIRDLVWKRSRVWYEIKKLSNGFFGCNGFLSKTPWGSLKLALENDSSVLVSERN